MACNDITNTALNETVNGIGRGAYAFIMLTLDKEVGCAVIINGKPYSGYKDASPDIAHMIIEYNGKLCTCGQNGCLNAYASTVALIGATREKMLANKDSMLWKIAPTLEAVDSHTAFKAAKDGDTSAKEIIDLYIEYLSCGVTNIINLFQPDIFVLGGEISSEGDALLAPLKKIVYRDQYARHSDKKTQIFILKQE